MPYNPQTWSDNDTRYPVSASRMNTLEGGVQAAQAAAEAAQATVGAPVGFSGLAAELQLQSGSGVQGGVMSGGAVTYQSSGVAAVAAGVAWVPTAAGGLRRVSWSATTVNIAPAANARLDQVVVSDAGTISVVAGTNAAGVTLVNRTNAGAPAVNQLRLADALASTTFSGSANCQDRRRWAAGARYSGDFGLSAFGGDSQSGSFNIELSGAPCIVTLWINAQTGGNAVGYNWNYTAWRYTRLNGVATEVMALNIHTHNDNEWVSGGTSGLWTPPAADRYNISQRVSSGSKQLWGSTKVGVVELPGLAATSN